MTRSSEFIIHGEMPDFKDNKNIVPSGIHTKPDDFPSNIISHHDTETGSLGGKISDTHGSTYGSSTIRETYQPRLSEEEGRLKEAYAQGQREGYSAGYDDGLTAGWNRHERAVRQPVYEPTPTELGQAEKLRLLAKLAEIGLPYDDSLVLQRTELEKDDSPISYVVDIALGLDGIRRFLRMSFDGIDSDLQTLTSTQIPVEDYPKYAILANQIIDKYVEAQKTR